MAGISVYFFRQSVSAPWGNASCNVIHPPKTCRVPITPSPPGSLPFGLWAPSPQPGLALLPWPPWWVAVTCQFPSVSSTPLLGLSWTTVFVSRLAGPFLTPSCSQFNSRPPLAALPEARGLPLGSVWSGQVQRAAGHRCACPPAKGASRLGLAGRCLLRHQSSSLTLLVTSTRA